MCKGCTLRLKKGTTNLWPMCYLSSSRLLSSAALSLSPPGASGNKGNIHMIEYIITGLIALGVGVYLMVALLRPDKF